MTLVFSEGSTSANRTEVIQNPIVFLLWHAPLTWGLKQEWVLQTSGEPDVNRKNSPSQSPPTAVLGANPVLLPCLRNSSCPRWCLILEREIRAVKGENGAEQIAKGICGIPGLWTGRTSAKSTGIFLPEVMEIWVRAIGWCESWSTQSITCPELCQGSRLRTWGGQELRTAGTTVLVTGSCSAHRQVWGHSQTLQATPQPQAWLAFCLFQFVSQQLGYFASRSVLGTEQNCLAFAWLCWCQLFAPLAESVWENRFSTRSPFSLTAGHSRETKIYINLIKMSQYLQIFDWRQLKEWCVIDNRQGVMA